MRWLLLLSLGVTSGCASLLGINSIDIDDDAGPDDDDGGVLLAPVTVEVLDGDEPVAGVDVVFHQGAELVATVRTNGDGLAVAELGGVGLVTFASIVEGQMSLRSVVVSPGDRVREVREVSLPLSVSITVPKPPADEVGVGVFTGSSFVSQHLASELPTTTTASQIPFSAVGPRGELVVWAVAVDMASQFQSATYAVIDADNAEPLQLPEFSSDRPFTGSVAGLVEGHTNQVFLSHIVADVLVPADGVETTASAVTQAFIADPTIAGGFELGVVDIGDGSQPAETHEIRLRLPASTLDAEIDLQAESLPPVSGVEVETAADGTLASRWTPYPAEVELCIVEIGFADSSGIGSWSVEAPAASGAVTLPALPDDLGLTPGAPTSVSITIQDFSGFASYADHRAALQRHPFAALPAEGTQRRARLSNLPIGP